VTIPQPGIFAQGTRSQYHLEFDVVPGTDPSAVAAAVARLREPLVTAGGTNIVVGFRAGLWRSIAPNDTPADAHDFAGVEGDGRRAPATPHDVWIWLHGAGPDVLLDNARAVVATLAPVATLAQEEPCFVYLDSRDLTGFIDGTENPQVQVAPEVALVPAGQPGEGGAHVITMKWVHDLAKFHALPPEEQEAVIGRTKPDSRERDDKPDTAHISRVVVEDEHGEELEIYRRSVPYGRINELGLYFVAFSADPTRFEIMLRRMFGTADTHHDHLTDFTKPVSGAFYFAPSLDALRALG
jgi:putative iron-dependent peroxidase